MHRPPSSPGAPSGSAPRPARGPFRPLLLGLLLAAGAILSACSKGAAAGPGSPDTDGSGQSQPRAPIERDLRDLVTAVTPLPASAGRNAQSEWAHRREDLLQRLRKGSQALGRAALARYRAKTDELDAVRAGLLDVAAHTDGAEAVPELEHLIQTFGEPMLLRTVACELLAEAAPQATVDLLGPILRETSPRMTYPAAERMLAAWNDAAKELQLDRSAFLGDIAVQLNREHETRQVAVRALADCRGPAAVEALETIMVESSGDHLLRRTATQSLAQVLPQEEFCAHVREVMANESDQEFQVFLADCLEKRCGG